VTKTFYFIRNLKLLKLIYSILNYYYGQSLLPKTNAAFASDRMIANGRFAVRFRQLRMAKIVESLQILNLLRHVRTKNNTIKKA
jgi:hypothetical protein